MHEAHPRRGLTVPQGAALTVGAVLATGVIILPALAADIAGPASLVAWVALVLLSIPLAGTFAALGARYPDAGGVSTYVRAAFGARAAAAVGWCFYFAVPLGAPAAAMFASGYVADTFGGGRTTTLATVAALLVVVTLMNAFGLRVSGRAQLGLAAVLAVLLLVTVVAALPHARLGNLTPFAPHGWVAVGPAAAALVWAFAGWEAVTSLSGEYRRPARDLPRATAIAVAVVGGLYLAVAFATVTVLGPAAGDSRAPLADLLAVGVGGPVRELTTVIAVLMTVGAINAYFAGASRLGAALGRDGALPSWFARGGNAGDVPRRSLAVVVLLAFVSLVVTAVADLDLHQSVLFITGAFTLVYVLGTAAAIRLLPGRSWPRAGAVVSFGCVCVLLVMTGVHVLLGLGLALAAVGYDLAVRRADLRRTAAQNLASPSATASERVAP